eukprot:352594-Chlamydomonas_euryale.AAC.9
MPPPLMSTQRVWSLPSNALAGGASSMLASPPLPVMWPPPMGYSAAGRLHCKQPCQAMPGHARNK